jgi:hypothetical protein
MKLIVFIMIMFAVSFGLDLAGYDTPTSLITSLVTGDFVKNFQGSSLYTKISAIFTFIAIGGGIVIGLFTRNSPESYLLSGIAAVFLGFVGDMIFFFNVIRGAGYEWLNFMLMPLFIVFVYGYVIVVIEWWRGTA